MLNKLSDISEAISCFHDANIESGKIVNGNLVLNVVFPLMKEMGIGFNFCFTIIFFECEDISFKTWPRIVSESPRIIKDINGIFSNPHWILEGINVNNHLQIICSQSNVELDFCGGELMLKSNAAKFYEKGGKELTLEELADECSVCWNAMEAK